MAFKKPNGVWKAERRLKKLNGISKKPNGRSKDAFSWAAVDKKSV
jgi:hypothetical protein